MNSLTPKDCYMRAEAVSEISMAFSRETVLNHADLNWRHGREQVHAVPKEGRGLG